ncbi:hypothetical protein KUA24_104 [Vibrio phage HNL01]|nr:hypothetical protein KUA24_104 [Vibrio phage HNL01]
MYGEFSKDIDTRYFARLLLYLFLFTMFTPFMLATDDALIANVTGLCAVLVYQLKTTDSKAVALGCYVGIFMSCWVTTSLVFNTNLIPFEWLQYNSHRIIRESIIFTLGALAYYNNAKDNENLNWLVGFIIYIEYLFVRI